MWMDDIKFLYGAEVAGQARLYLRGFLNDELALRAMGASWRLHSDTEWEHSRIDILAIFSVPTGYFGIRSSRLCGSNSTLGSERGRRR
jgi:hypothetical protein